MARAKVPDWVERELARVDEAKARGQAATADEPRAVRALFDRDRELVVVMLDNDAVFAFPPRLAQGLADASPTDLSMIEVSPQGSLLSWPRLDVDHSVRNLLSGVFGSGWWASELASRGGRSRTPARAAAARLNGAKGGRPRKKSITEPA